MTGHIKHRDVDEIERAVAVLPSLIGTAEKEW